MTVFLYVSAFQGTMCPGALSFVLLYPYSIITLHNVGSKFFVKSTYGMWIMDMILDVKSFLQWIRRLTWLNESINILKGASWFLKIGFILLQSHSKWVVVIMNEQYFVFFDATEPLSVKVVTRIRQMYGCVLTERAVTLFCKSRPIFDEDMRF